MPYTLLFQRGVYDSKIEKRSKAENFIDSCSENLLEAIFTFIHSFKLLIDIPYYSRTENNAAI